MNTDFLSEKINPAEDMGSRILGKFKHVLIEQPKQNKGLERIYRFDISRNSNGYSGLKGSA